MPNYLNILREKATHAFAYLTIEEARQVGIQAQGIIAAGIAVQAQDTGRVLMLQRALSDEDPAAGKWEFPGGTLDPEETPILAAVREFQEETGLKLPPGEWAGQWLSSSGVYKGFIYLISAEQELDLNPNYEDRHVLNPDDPDGDEIEVIAWWNVQDLLDNPAVREELRDTDWKIFQTATAEFTNTCHDPGGTPEGGQFCETHQTEHTGPTVPPIDSIRGHFPVHTETAEAMKNALAAIESVHSVPNGIKKVAVTHHSDPGTFGEYSDDEENNPISIAVDSTGNHKELTFAHEYGHYLDDQAGLDNSQVMDALSKSFAIRQLESRSGEEMGYGFYLLAPKEQFARAYAQYITSRSKNQRLEGQLGRIIDEFGLKHYSQWDDADFEPIASAFDEMFQERGLLKGTTASAQTEEFYNKCHDEQTGHFCEDSLHGNMRVKIEKASKEEHQQAKAKAKAWIRIAKVPSQAEVAKGRAEVKKAKQGESNRTTTEDRGGSAEARRRQSENLFKEFGGEKRGYVVDHQSGIKLHWTTDPTLNPNQYPIFTRGRIFTAIQGGGYTLDNLLPESFPTNRARGSRPIRKENLP